MNRKGNIPTILLPFAMLVLVGIALFNFNAFSADLGSVGRFGGLVSGVNFAEAYVENVIESSISDVILLGGIDSDFRNNFMSAVDGKDLRLDIGGNFFGKVRTGEFVFEPTGDTYTLEIEDVFVKSKVGESEIIKRFDIFVEFDSEKVSSVRFINKGRLS